MLFDLAPRRLKVPKRGLRSVSDEEFLALLGKLEDTCALDMVQPGGETLDWVGTRYSLTRERIRQLEFRAKRSFRRRTRQMGLQIHLEQMPTKYFVDVVVDLRSARGWTNKVLAYKAGLPPHAISAVMDGRTVYGDYIARLAQAFGISVAELVHGTEFQQD